MNQPYIFYFDTPYGLVEFPITPGELTITNDSNNKVVTLIDEGDINILKSPSLIEVEFESRFPTHKYPYSSEPNNISYYHDIFTKLKEEKKPFKFIVARTGLAETSTGNTRLLMALEKLETNESADEGDDVIYSFTLKQYKEYGVVILSSNAPTKNRDSSSKDTSQSNYKVKSGDCLWNIAKKFYGDGSRWVEIYNANKSIIEETANKYRNGKGSSNGHWIYPGTELIIPGITSSTGGNQSSGGTSSSGTTSNKSSQTAKSYMVSILNNLHKGTTSPTQLRIALTYVKNGETQTRYYDDSIDQVVDAGSVISLKVYFKDLKYAGADNFLVSIGGNTIKAVGGQFSYTKVINKNTNIVIKGVSQVY